MLHDSTTSWLLTSGEQRLLHAPAGSRWIAVRGGVRLDEPPRWLADRLVGIQLVLHGGTEHVVEHGGWVAVQALHDSALVCETRPSLASLLRAAWRIIRPGHRTCAAV